MYYSSCRVLSECTYYYHIVGIHVIVCHYTTMGEYYRYATYRLVFMLVQDTMALGHASPRLCVRVHSLCASHARDGIVAVQMPTTLGGRVCPLFQVSLRGRLNAFAPFVPWVCGSTHTKHTSSAA
jgi:hypothetical protein